MRREREESAPSKPERAERETHRRQILLFAFFLLLFIRVINLNHVAIAVGSRVGVAAAVRGRRRRRRRAKGKRDSPVKLGKAEEGSVLCDSERFPLRCCFLCVGPPKRPPCRLTSSSHSPSTLRQLLHLAPHEKLHRHRTTVRVGSEHVVEVFLESAGERRASAESSFSDSLHGEDGEKRAGKRTHSQLSRSYQSMAKVLQMPVVSVC